MSALLAACTSGPAVPSEELAASEIPRLVQAPRPLPEAFSRKAIAYSGFRTGQSPQNGVFPTREQILEDLQLLANAGFGLIRLYGSLGHGSDVVETIAEHQLDFKVQLGAYISGTDADNGDHNRNELDAACLHIPIVIGETGWQSYPSATLENAPVANFARSVGHPVNQAWYYRDMLDWTYGADLASPGDGFTRPAALFYFAAFDEPWKQADDNWGLWDVDRQPKFVIGGTIPDTPPVFFEP